MFVFVQKKNNDQEVQHFLNNEKIFLLCIKYLFFYDVVKM